MPAFFEFGVDVEGVPDNVEGNLRLLALETRHGVVQRLLLHIRPRAQDVQCHLDPQPDDPSRRVDVRHDIQKQKS